MNMSKRVDLHECQAEPCVINDKSKDRDKRNIACRSPGCSRQFHAACIGQARKSDKELNNLFFVCLQCEDYLKFSAQIVQKPLMTEFDSKLSALKLSILQTIEEKITFESTKILNKAQSMFDLLSQKFEEEIKDMKREMADAHELVLGLLKDKDEKIDALQSELQQFKAKCSSEIDGLRSTCVSIQNQMGSHELKRKKKSFIVRNFPEKECAIDGQPVSTSLQAVIAISQALKFEEEVALSIQEVFRLGKPRDDGKPRLIMVRTTERTTKLFLSKARRLKDAAAPLNKVFLQEDLPREVNQKLASMRKRAYQHRIDNPEEEAYVKNKKLIINGAVVDEIGENF